MALFNYATKEITLKIVYYGPGLSGKTTNLQHLHAILNPETKGKLLSLATESDRTLFFDFLPVELGKIRDFSIRFQLYTVPGQVRYNATRKVVLKGADGVVFVADSQKAMKDQNIESFDNMLENLVSNNINPEAIQIVLQYNKRDLSNILSVDELNKDLNPDGRYDVIEGAAINGTGVEDAFKRITRLLLKDISRKHKIEIQPAETKKEAPPAAPTPPSPVPPQPRISTREAVPEPPAAELKMPEPESAEAEPVFDTSDLLPEEEAEKGAELTPEHESRGAATVEEPALLVEMIDEEMPEAETVSMAEEETVLPVQEIPETRPAYAESSAPVPGPPTPASIPAAQPIAFPLEKLDNLSDDVMRLAINISKISDTLAHLQRSVTEMKAEMLSARSETTVSREAPAKEPDLRETKEFKEMRREQKETLDILRDISEILNSMKEKKSWFRF